MPRWLHASLLSQTALNAGLTRPPSRHYEPLRCPCPPFLLRRVRRRRPRGCSSIRGWLHEIKHDGFRIIARKNGAQVRLYSRPGNDLTDRFLLIVETLA